MRFQLLSLLLVAIVSAALSSSTRAQFAMPANISPDQRRAMMEAARNNPELRKQIEEQMKAAGAQPPDGDKPKEGENKEGDKKSNGDGGNAVKRPDKPEKPADPKELKVAPDKDGRVQFSFNGQPWKDVLQWYADVAKLSFDWTELPGDYLNLTTTRSYTLDETRDLLNRHLLARGYTLIIKGEILSAVKIDKLDPSLIPQVNPDDLEDHPPYEFARVRFALPATMEPEKAKDDVKILLSPNAKVVPLLASKQLMVIDAVVNLRDVRDLIYGEQLAIKEDVRPRPFPIRHQRADWIADQVMVVLGMDPKSRKGPQDAQMEQQKMQMMMQMQQQGKPMPPGFGKEEPKVFIAVDKRRNSLLVNAPPAEMKIIERTIADLDVESGMEGAMPVGAMEMRKYHTVTVSPDSIVNALKEIGSLDPLTQLQTDAKSKTIFAYATERDHRNIKGMIADLDGSGRKLYVIPLSRRSPADQVAGTIQALMAGEKKKDDDNDRRRFFFYGWGGDEEEESDEGQFLIQADIEQNRLLLKATEEEHAEVMSLLSTLGVVSTPGSRGDRTRVLEATNPEATIRLLERLQENWNGKNPIIINGAEELDEREGPALKSDEKPREEPKVDKVTATPFELLRTRFTAAPANATDEADDAGASEPREKDGEAPPIIVTVTPDGRLLLRSDDPAALDQLEDLIAELEPPQDDFAKFELTNADCYYVYLNLKDYFADELKGQQESVYDYWGDYRGSRDKESGPMTLGRKRPLRFIWDTDTNTILVQGASKKQLGVIEKLVEIWDEPIGEDAVASRKTEAIPIKYSKAQDIAAALKEVFRDLLSSKDKEFANKEGQKTTRNETYYRFGGGGSENKDKKSTPVKMKFEGALSIGVDEISNTLIISAEENVWSSIREIVTQLDERANPHTTVEVYEVRAGVSSRSLKAALAQALSEPWPGGKPPGKAAQNQGGGDQRGGGDQNGNQGRNRGNGGNRNGGNNN